MKMSDEDMKLLAADDDGGLYSLLDDVRLQAEARNALGAVIIFIENDGSMSRAVWTKRDEDLAPTVARFEEMLTKAQS